MKRNVKLQRSAFSGLSQRLISLWLKRSVNNESFIKNCTLYAVRYTLFFLCATLAFADFSGEAKLAHQYTEQGFWSKSLPLWKKLLREDPNFTQGHKALGSIYFGRGDYEQAMHHFWEVLRIEPQDIQAHSWLGVAFLRRGYEEKALEEIRKGTRKSRGHVSVLWALGEIAFFQKDFLKAERLYKKALHLAGVGHWEIYLSLANLEEKRGHLSRVEKFLKQARRAGLEKWSSDAMLADILFRKKDDDAALQLYRKLLTPRSFDSEIHRRLGILYEMRNDFIHAKESYEAYVALKPTDVEVLNALGMIHFKLNDLSKAETSFRRVLDIQPQNAWAYNNLALTQSRQGKFDAALENHRKAIEVEPRAEFYHNLGNTYIRLKDYFGALVILEKILKIDPTYEKAYRKIGLCHLHLENYEEAIENLKFAHRAQPKNAIIMDEIGFAYFKRQDMKGALEWFQKASERDPENPRHKKHLKSVEEALKKERG